MTQRRLLKAAEAIREVVASAILTEIRDPRVKDVTVIGVEVTPDMREATVSVSVMGDEKQKTLSLRGLQNSAGFLQAKIARRIDTRYTPKLQFELNRGAENALVVGELLNKIRLEQESDQTETPPNPVVSEADASEASETDSDESMSTSPISVDDSPRPESP
ncbi:MAG: 30S ribosome-binding factor RbfA [Myxococcota bacterium]